MLGGGGAADEPDPESQMVQGVTEADISEVLSDLHEDEVSAINVSAKHGAGPAPRALR